MHDFDSSASQRHSLTTFMVSHFYIEISRAMPDLRTIVYVSTATRLLSIAELEILLIEASDLNFQNSVREAVGLSKSPLARYLPGWSGVTAAAAVEKH